MSTEQSAYVKAIEFLEKRGWEVQDVCKLGNEHSGYDLVIRRGLDVCRVEVKGTLAAYKGIPDLYGTEVDSNGRLVADFLLVVFMPEGLPEKFAFIPRDDFPEGVFQRKVGYRIQPAYKNAKFIKRFLSSSEESDQT